MAGYNNVSGNRDCYMVNVDEDGEMISEYSYGGDEDDSCYGIIQSADGGFVLVGQTVILHTLRDIQLTLIRVC